MFGLPCRFWAVVVRYWPAPSVAPPSGAAPAAGGGSASPDLPSSQPRCSAAIVFLAASGDAGRGSRAGRLLSAFLESRSCGARLAWRTRMGRPSSPRSPRAPSSVVVTRASRPSASRSFVSDLDRTGWAQGTWPDQPPPSPPGSAVTGPGAAGSRGAASAGSREGAGFVGGSDVTIDRGAGVQKESDPAADGPPLSRGLLPLVPLPLAASPLVPRPSASAACRPPTGSARPSAPLGGTCS